MIQKVEMYQAVCDGCGEDIKQIFESEKAAEDFAIHICDWEKQGNRIYCHDCMNKVKRNNGDDIKMRLSKEIRIKAESNIEDIVVLSLVSMVVKQGKISNNGRNYCFVTVMKYQDVEYRVEVNDKRKSIMFYVFKK